MALTIAEILRAINPDVGLVLNVDGLTYRVGVEDVNSDEILAALEAGNVNILRATPASVIATILNTASLSNEIDLNGSALQTILMPAAWTAASLTFQIAEASGGTFRNVYDDSGTEVVVTTAVSRAIPMPAELAGARFVIIRSGTVGTPVNQGGDRIITVLLKG